MNRKTTYILSVIFIFITISFINAKKADNQKTDAKSKILTQIAYYKERYKAPSLNQKIVDNFGNGRTELYGLRNVRPVLHGVVYRGGANNFYHNTKARENQNPLPEDGLLNLCAEGFSRAVYLYSKNFKTAPASVIADRSKNDTLFYMSNTIGNRNDQKALLQLVQDVIDSKIEGPIYIHCWNGWHQSGYASALILMQFAGYSNEEAASYWKANADGGTKGYEHIVKAIMAFTPFKDFKVDKDVLSAMRADS